MNWFFLLIIVISLGILYLRISLLIVTIHGLSMSPTLQPGDRVLVWRHYPPRWLKEGQIILVWPEKYPSPRILQAISIKQKHQTTTLFIKRVVGLPNSTIVTRFTDLPDKAIQSQKLSLYDAEGRMVWDIPTRHFFVQGDTRGIDSTSWGPLPFRCFRGIMLIKLSIGKA